jgi:hypothetical protein
MSVSLSIIYAVFIIIVFTIFVDFAFYAGRQAKLTGKINVKL